MKILVTGAAGFIGFYVSLGLLKKGHTVVGLDNLNDYYDVNLKLDRIDQLGINKKEVLEYNVSIPSASYSNFSFINLNIEDRDKLPELFLKESFDVVCNLAAQAGVRYSVQNPEVYVDSNVVGFLNILECCRNSNIKHLVYGSSSSVYGLNDRVPFEASDKVDQPASLYAATKKSNELMAHAYSHLYKLPTTGLRFFTVYGPWGRPDMAIFLFTDAILKGRTIDVFNNGKLERDFTYISDITEGVLRMIETDISERTDKSDFYKVYNIGNNSSIKLLDFITEIEKNLGIKASKRMLEMQAGDVEKTWANIEPLKEDYNFTPSTPISKGIKEYIIWHQNYYN